MGVNECDVIVAYAINLCGNVVAVPWARIIEEMSIFEAVLMIQKEQMMSELAAGLLPTVFFKPAELFDYLMIVNYVCLGVV